MTGRVAMVMLVALLAGCSTGAVSPRPSATEPSVAPVASTAPTATAVPSVTDTPRPTATPAAVLREIDVRDAGWAMTLAGGALWVQVDPPTDAIVRIDVASGAVVPAIARGHRARAGAEGLWAVGDGFLIRVDPATGREIGRAEVQGAFAHHDGFVWVLDDDGIHRVDPATGKVTHTINRDPAVCEDTKDLAIGFDAAWIACKGGFVDRVDLAEGSVTEIATARGSHTLLITEDAVWVTNHEAGSTSRIDPATNAVRTIHGVGSGIGITEGGGLVWVATNSQIVGLRPDGDEAQRISVPGERFWYDLVWTEEGIWGSTAGAAVYLIDVP